MNFIKLSVRSLLFRWRQYVSLFLVCATGIGVSLFLIFIMNGMLSSLSMKAKIYYGGDFQFLGGSNRFALHDCRNLVSKLSEIFGEKSVVSPRIDIDNGSIITFYYEGVEVPQRVVKGVDFTKEHELFSKFNYQAGGIDNIANTNGVLISSGVASMLNVSVGDSMSFILRTSSGYINVVQVVVQGIFVDSSVFGVLTAYFDINFFRNTFSFPEFYSNRIVVFFPNTKITEKEAKFYQNALSKDFNMFELVENKYDFYDLYLTGQLETPVYALIKLNANLDDLKIVIDAMKSITSFIIFALITIIVVGISSTYRVIVMKRINEIGIYKAIGMNRNSVMILLLTETLTLLLIGCFCGVIVCFGLDSIIKQFSFSSIPAFDIFLQNGYLIAEPSVFSAVAIFLVVIVTTVCAVMFSVWSAIKITPVQALAVTE